MPLHDMRLQTALNVFVFCHNTILKPMPPVTMGCMKEISELPAL
jgi:hypothetical protein